MGELDIPGLITEFVVSHDVSSSSRMTYKNALLQFSKWCQQNNITEPARQTILSYKFWLDTHLKSSCTKATYLVVVRQFFSWLEDRDIYPNVSRGIKGAKRLIKSHKKDSLSIVIIKKLLHSFDLSTINGMRNHAITNLLIRTGMRLKEISAATIEDIQMMDNDARLWVHGKGRAGKDEFVILTDKALSPIKNYLRFRKPKKANEPLFCSTSNRNFGGKISTFTLSRMVKKQLRSIGINSKRISAHSLRHTFGVLAIKSGASLYEVQLAMRHSAPTTTEVYLGDIEKIKRLEASPERKINALLGD